jgi:hypothetical protein
VSPGGHGLQAFETNLHGLRHEIAFHPTRGNTAANISATLTNESERNLTLCVSERPFPATLSIRTAQGVVYEAFEKDHLEMLLHASWIAPVVKLPAGESMRWVVPLDSVVTCQGKPITSESLSNATMTSGLQVSGKTLRSKRIRID